MKALSIQQPWAELIVSVEKDIEIGLFWFEELLEIFPIKSENKSRYRKNWKEISQAVVA